MTKDQERVMAYVDKNHHDRMLDQRIDSIMSSPNRVYDNPDNYAEPLFDNGHVAGHNPVSLTTYDKSSIKKLNLKQKLEEKFNIVVNFISEKFKTSTFTSIVVSGCLVGTVGLTAYGLMKASQDLENETPQIVQEYDVADHPLLGDYDTVEVYNTGEAILRNSVDESGAREVNGVDASSLVPKTTATNDINKAEILDVNASAKTR